MPPQSVPEPPGSHPGWPARPGPLRVRDHEIGLRPVRLRDGTEWSRIRVRDESHLRPWEPTTYGGWARRNAAADWPSRWYLLRSSARRGLSLPFAITVDGRLGGHVMIGNVVREPLLSAYVGYWIDSRLGGRGITTAAVALVLDHCFGPVHLHRVEATVRPENAASIAVLARLGFRREGLLRRYLDVDGAWRDHYAFAVTAEETPPGGFVGRLVRAGRAARA
ncbi:GNAT family N-acetyltransferase [Pseudonocardia sp. HH130630-07]|uniref:GNAT family N-acetyltransferase n=1 Tax=Pseudonocardia sp. HH130630-07 TaxID=1690815 RepID=UPI0008153A6C|nr:GNAT family protein [Pseudonocardia sp. HH130630-07]ANY06125.1 GCN5 family acetyltransferase [Pseudonocardia sp. HH130630-07]